MKKIIRPDFLSLKIYCSNEALSFPNDTSPDEFVSRPIRATALCIPTVHHFTRKIHAHIREQKIPWSYFSASEKNYHRQVNGFGDYHLYLYVAIEQKA